MTTTVLSPSENASCTTPVTRTSSPSRGIGRSVVTPMTPVVSRISKYLSVRTLFAFSTVPRTVTVFPAYSRGFFVMSPIETGNQREQPQTSSTPAARSRPAARVREAAALKSSGLRSGLQTDRFDVVPVEVPGEGAVVVLAVVGANAGRAVVAAARGERGLVKGVDRPAVGARERHVRPRGQRRRRLAGAAGVRRDDPEDRLVLRLAHADDGAVVCDDRIAERGEGGLIEAARGGEVLHSNCH